MAKKIKLSDIKVKSFDTILNKEERKATKGGYYNSKTVRDSKINNNTWTANTIVDIRNPLTSGGGSTDKKGKLSDLNSLNP